jgi:peptidase M28-like protein
MSGKSLKAFIVSIISDVGPRIAGSDEESKAAEIIASEFKTRGADTSIQLLPTYPEHIRALIRIMTGAYFAAVVVYPVFPAATMVITISAVSMLLLARKVSAKFIDWFLKEGETQNIIGIYKPNVKSSKSAKFNSSKGETVRRLIFSGHHDSPYMMPLLSMPYKPHVHKIENLVVFGLALTIPMGILRTVFVGPFIDFSFDFAFAVGWWDFLFPVTFLGLILALFFRSKMLTNEKNLGANDNLSAIAVLLGIGDYLKEKKLVNTEVWLVSFGSEEVYGYGSNGFAKKYRDVIKTALNINMETVGAGALAIIEEEKHHSMVYSPEVVELIKKGGKRRRFDLEEVAITYGGTDSYAIIKGGGKSACLFGMDETKLFSLWHSPLDNLENISEEKLSNALSICLGIIEEMEETDDGGMN